MSPDEIRRHSQALDAELIPDLEERARAEVRNGLRQFDLGMQIVDDALEKGGEYRLRPSAVLALHRVDVSDMEDVIGGLLAKQLTNVFEEASGKATS
ncbi:hypothetical protein [Methyloceanibacter sp.]|uniref:hypothetical protein n=1 Tax=Methyloceanibacter sp. TaxID=1965321 RepID=UPI003D6D867D